MERRVDETRRIIPSNHGMAKFEQWIGLHIKQVELSPVRRANEARFLH